MVFILCVRTSKRVLSSSDGIRIRFRKEAFLSKCRVVSEMRCAGANKVKRESRRRIRVAPSFMKQDKSTLASTTSSKLFLVLLENFFLNKISCLINIRGAKLTLEKHLIHMFK